MIQHLVWAAVVSIMGVGSAHAQSTQELVDAAKTPQNVLTWGGSYDQTRFSPLKQINTGTVKRLVPVYSYSLDDDRGQESQPIVYDGVLYVTTHKSTIAIDAVTGRQLWKTNIEYPADAQRIACCGVVNRGVAIYNGKVFRGTIDAHVVAYDAKTGKEAWRQKVADYTEAYSITGAPLVANGVLITGIGGGEYGIRGFLDGWDPETGNHLWRRYTVPGPGEPGNETWPGDTWQRGGAATWLTGSYDPQLDLVYWGTGNGGPWNAEFRKGDNLYIDSVLAIRPKTGEIVWHFQFTPNDPYDYDGVNELVQTELKINGKDRKVIFQANRNGFLYVLDRATGEVLSAKPFINNINWTDGIDPKTHRPIESALTKRMRETGETVLIWPSQLGGKNWSPLAYNPKKQLAYINTQNYPFKYKPLTPEYRKGTFYLGADFVGEEFVDENRGILKAVDLLTGKAKWEVPSKIPYYAGVLATEGGLVFTGSQTGEFLACDAETGRKLWSYNVGSGVIGIPVTFEQNGRQYVSIVSGNGAVYSMYSGDERLAAIPNGGILTTFALFDEKASNTEK